MQPNDENKKQDNSPTIYLKVLGYRDGDGKRHLTVPGSEHWLQILPRMIIAKREADGEVVVFNVQNAIASNEPFYDPTATTT